MRGPATLLLGLGLGLLAAPAAAQEVALTAPRPGTAQPLQLWAGFAEGTGWSIRVTDEAGRERQRFTVPSEAPEPAPRIADIDGDGAGDLWVPVLATTANLGWAVWTLQPREARFRPAGEVSGLLFARDPGGWLVAIARNGCCAVSLVFHAVNRRDGTLREAFALERPLDNDGLARGCTPRGPVPQDVRGPWCRSRDPEALPAGVARLF